MLSLPWALKGQTIALKHTFASEPEHELFSYTFVEEDAKKATKENFIGNFVLGGIPPWDSTEISVNVVISEEQDNLYMTGIYQHASAVLCNFDAQTGILSIATQKLDSVYGTYDIRLETNIAAIPLELGYSDLMGSAEVISTCESDGFHIVSNAAGGALMEIRQVTLTPANPAALAVNAKNGLNVHNYISR